MATRTQARESVVGLLYAYDLGNEAIAKFSDVILEDKKIRTYLTARLMKASVAKIAIERTLKLVTITIHTARPGIIIGKKGADIEKLKASLQKLVGKAISINIKEEKKAQISAQLVAENVATQLERRVAFRRAMKKVIQGAQKSGAKGIKVAVAGRLGGAEMARTEWYLEGRVPLHTLRAKIDYGFAEAHTTYGIIGVKVWIFKGEVLTKGVPEDVKEEKKERSRKRAPRKNSEKAE